MNVARLDKILIFCLTTLIVVGLFTLTVLSPACFAVGFGGNVYSDAYIQEISLNDDSTELYKWKYDRNAYSVARIEKDIHINKILISAYVDENRFLNYYESGNESRYIQIDLTITNYEDYTYHKEQLAMSYNTDTNIGIFSITIPEIITESTGNYVMTLVLMVV